MPRLSILIPTLGKLPLMEQGLVSVLMHRPDDCEVIVVLNGPYADPYDLTDEVRFVDAPSGADWATSVAHGLAASESPWIHVLDPGVEVEAHWLEGPLARFEDPAVAAVAPLVIEGFREPPLAIAGVDYDPRHGRIVRPVAMSELFGLEPRTVTVPHRAAFFIRREVLDCLLPHVAEVGDALADVELGLEIQFAGLQVVCDPTSRTTRLEPGSLAGAERWGASFRYGRAMERVFWRNLPRCGWWRGLAARCRATSTAACDDLRRPNRLAVWAGRTLGLAEALRAPRHWREMRQMARELAARRTAERPQSRIPAPHMAVAGSIPTSNPRAA